MTIIQPLIYLFTDFGSTGPYLGQMEAAILSETLQSKVINLCSDAPCQDPKRAAYLLAALTQRLPSGATLVCVVDPGVGGSRRPLLVMTAGMALIGPDNGLMSQVVRQCPESEISEILVEGDGLSATFHGRDLFAPVAANVAKGQPVATRPLGSPGMAGLDWPSDLEEVIYIDHYGNAFTGIRAGTIDVSACMLLNGQRIVHAPTFSAMAEGEPFWYANSCGLVEIAVNKGRADTVLGVSVGDAVRFEVA